MTDDWLLSQLHPQRSGFWLMLGPASMVALLLFERLLNLDRHSLLRPLRRVLVPYCGLIVGALSPRLMGLSDLDWVAGLGLGLTVMAGILTLLFLIQLPLHSEEAERDPRTSHNAADRVLDAGSQEFYWCFLRGATWEILLSSPFNLDAPGYWAVWLSSLVALSGIFLHYQSAYQKLVAVVVLTVTTVLFFYTRNFWLCWLLHLLAQMVLGQSATVRLFSADESLTKSSSQARSSTQRARRR